MLHSELYFLGELGYDKFVKEICCGSFEYSRQLRVQDNDEALGLPLCTDGKRVLDVEICKVQAKMETNHGASSSIFLEEVKKHTWDKLVDDFHVDDGS